MNDPSLSAESWEPNGSSDVAPRRSSPRGRGPGLLPPAGPLRVRALAVICLPLLLVGAPLALSAVNNGGTSAGTQSQQVGGQPAAADGGQASLFPAAPTDTPSADPSAGTPFGDPGGSSPTATDWSTDSSIPSNPSDTTPLTAPPSASDSGSTSAGASPSGTPVAPAQPVDVVLSYFAAINSGDYKAAWSLGGSNLGGSYAAFAAGFADTVRDTVTVVSVQGASVKVALVSLQRDGTQHTYHGSYTVSGGVITSATVQQTG